MSLADATWQAACRASLASLLGVLLAWPLRHALWSMRGHTGGVAVGVALAIAVPPLAVAYAATALLPHLALAPAFSPWCLLVLLVGRVLPFVALILALVPPPPLSGTAAHTLTLLPANAPLRRLRSHVCGRLRSGSASGGMLAFAAGFVLAFQDFELTARLGASSWTVWLFDAQAGGVDVAAVLRQCVGPVALTLSVLALAVLAGIAAPGQRTPPRMPRPRPIRWLGLGACLGLTVVVPLALLLLDGATHVGAALRSAAARNELAWSLAYATTAAAVAGLTAQGLSPRTARGGSWLRTTTMLLACTPGLGGSLVLALVTRQLAAGSFADTPLPALFALTLWILPYALLLRHALTRDETAPGPRAATMLGHLEGRTGAADAIVRALRGRPRLWTFAVLMPLSLQDVVVGSILAPPHAPPLTVRLHNLAHYGHSHTVSAQMLVLAAAGVLPLLLPWAADGRRLVAARRSLRRR